jgi:hypothetical protein
MPDMMHWTFTAEPDGHPALSTTLQMATGTYQCQAHTSRFKSYINTNCEDIQIVSEQDSGLWTLMAFDEIVGCSDMPSQGSHLEGTWTSSEAMGGHKFTVALDVGSQLTKYLGFGVA